VPALLDKRLVIVTGKGGVGKTTVAAALGLAGVLGGSRLFQYLTAAAPGLSELVTIGKVWDLAQIERRTGSTVFDIAIVDAPATGHALAMLRSPSTFAAVARVGPVGRHAAAIDRSLRNRKHTGVVMAALPEEMPVNETVEFERALRRELDMRVDAIVVNAVHPARFRREEIKRVRAAAGGRPVTQAALSAAVSEHLRARGEHAQVRRLRRAARAPVAALPRIFEPELGREHIERLSAELERRL
jgi:anion-transporting  ArsA/GET3 family ATPase